MRVLLPALACCLFATIAYAQAGNSPTPLVHLTVQDIASRLNAPGPAAAEMLDKHAGYYTLIVTRRAGASVERHDHWIDYITVVSGEVTFAYGGTRVGNDVDTQGESHGGILNKATVITLHAGDYMQVPAGVPHVMTKPSARFYYTQVKVRV